MVYLWTKDRLTATPAIPSRRPIGDVRFVLKRAAVRSKRTSLDFTKELSRAGLALAQHLILVGGQLL